MSVHKHGKNWQVRIIRKGHPPQFKTFTRKADADAYEKEVVSEMQRGVFVSRNEAERTTLSELLQRYIDEYIPRLSENDRRRQTNRVLALMRRDIAKKFVGAIRSTDISAFIRERESESASGNTIRLDIAVISRVFNVAQSSWGFPSLTNPCSHVLRPKLNAGRQRRINSPGEWKRLLRAASKRFRLVLRFAVRTAMRREEIATLTWKNVDLKKRTAFLPQTKNGDARTVPLSPRALAVLRAVKQKNDESVFGMSANSITQAMSKACRKANIEDLRFHDLRHEAISRLFEQTDLDVMEIKSISGHRSMQM